MILVIISAIVFSSAGIFTKGVDTDAWGVIFWRGTSAAAFTLGYLLLRGALAREIAAFRLPTLVVTLMMAAGTAAFIPAFKLSSVTNVALIYAAAPFLLQRRWPGRSLVSVQPALLSSPALRRSQAC